MFCTLFLFLLFVHSNEAMAPRTMDWCIYWSKQGINRPECFSSHRLPLQFRSNPSPSPLTHWSFNRQPRTPSYLLNKDGKLPTCGSVQNIDRCIKSHHCTVSTMCWENAHACCTPILPIFSQIRPSLSLLPSIPSGCPLPSSLDYKCAVENPISWCSSDVQCTIGNVHKCCPTGCGNNICVSSESSRRHKAPLNSLPLVDISCTPGGTSWCQSDSDCKSSSARRRFCRSTHCGHNICVLQFGQSWIVA
ncbi:hypothetical protein PFISCL1PPCAC_15010 [Pristionchus fissidentatus]|uniref:WAP domain-containing protein n=1 Tax=Pristionchus fissidentatus TaxID=1538716 RepID=A0AAV5VZR3_9BILA|nr:hypothetical protein PFISCL1PPCAC_15010 [Pristionchus fissidentatus]